MLNKLRRIIKSSIVFFLVFPAYIAAHVAVYLSVAHFFPFSQPFEKNILIWVLFMLGAFLGFSIMISTLLAHRWDNHFNRKYYFFSGVWLGICWRYICSSKCFLMTSSWVFINTDNCLHETSFIFKMVVPPGVEPRSYANLAIIQS